MAKRKFKVVITQRMPEQGIKLLNKRKFNLIYRNEDSKCPRSWLEKNLPNCDAVWITVNELVDKEFLDWAGNRLRIISTLAVGYDKIDLKEATERNIIVTNTPDILSDAVADYTWALMLNLARRVKEADTFVRDNRWKEAFIPLRITGTSVKNKTLGILGYGRIGKEIAFRSLGFGMRIIYNNRDTPVFNPISKASAVSLTQLFTESDFLVISTSLNDESYHLVDIEKLSLMKPTSFLVNIARGQVVVEEDLLQILVNKQIAGAALDVFDTEPLSINSGFCDLDNVLLSPHMASEDRETRDEMAKLCASSIMIVLIEKGMPRKNRVI